MRHRIDRASPGDLTVLAADRSAVPMNTAAVLWFEPDSQVDPAELHDVLARRLAAVPRLRRMLMRTPPLAGRPIWVDDTDFRLADHLTQQRPPGAADEATVLALAAELVCTRLDPARPPWRAVLAVDPVGRVAAAVVVLGHVLADGVGGLALLAALADDPRSATEPAPTEPSSARPGYRELVVDAWGGRVRTLRSVPARVAAGFRGLGEIGLFTARRVRAERTSLNRPTSARRVVAVVRRPLEETVATAKRVGGTVNDVVLAAVTGALLAELRRRGEHPPELVISVPVSGRVAAAADDLGNDTGVRGCVVPAIADHARRLGAIVIDTHGRAAADRATSAGPLGLAFRGLAGIGIFGWFVDHQRLVHSFETNLRGPARPLRIGGRRVTAVVPLAVNPGNVGVSFAVLSYAGTLGVTVVADPVLLPDPSRLAADLDAVFAALAPVSGEAAASAAPERGTEPH